MDKWVLVADASRARIFSPAKPGKPWRLIEELEHQESRMKNRELDPKEQGRQRQSAGMAHRPRMEPRTAPQQVEKNHFAQQLADKLSQAVVDGDCTSLVLVAPPHFLGQLKNTLSDRACKSVSATVGKDYTGSDARELASRLDEVVNGQSLPGSRRA